MIDPDMLDSLSINDFQSLGEVTLELAPVTLLVGRSNSGKSAIFRALRTLGRNTASVKHLVRHGADSLSVTAVFGDSSRVAVVRGEGLSTYFVQPPNGDVRELVKAGTTVPEDVAAVLRWPTAGNGDDVTFSSQFDTPFLLDVPASQVAKALGALSNIDVLLDASKEARSRARKAGGESKTLESEAALCVVRAEEFAVQATRARALAEGAREALQEAQDAFAAATRYEAMAEEATTVGAALKALQAKTYPLPDPADLQAAEQANVQAATFDALARDARAVGEALKAEQAVLAAATQAVQDAESEYDAILKEAKVCEACGQVEGSGVTLEQVGAPA